MTSQNYSHEMRRGNFSKCSLYATNLGSGHNERQSRNLSLWSRPQFEMSFHHCLSVTTSTTYLGKLNVFHTNQLKAFSTSTSPFDGITPSRAFLLRKLTWGVAYKMNNTTLHSASAERRRICFKMRLRTRIFNWKKKNLPYPSMIQQVTERVRQIRLSIACRLIVRSINFYTKICDSFATWWCPPLFSFFTLVENESRKHEIVQPFVFCAMSLYPFPSLSFSRTTYDVIHRPLYEWRISLFCAVVQV